MVSVSFTSLVRFGVQLLSCVRLFETPWTAACQASLSFTISCSLIRLMSIESMMPSNHLILCCPLLFLPSIFSSIRVFSNESALCIRWPKYWSYWIPWYWMIFGQNGQWDSALGLTSIKLKISKSSPVQKLCTYFSFLFYTPENCNRNFFYLSGETSSLSLEFKQ